MTTYTAPLKDIRYTLKHVGGMADISALPAYEHASEDIVDAVLEEAGKLVNNVIAPLNWGSDQQGAVLKDGVVTTSPGFKDAYEQFVEGGWNSLPFDPEYGGQGLPQVLAAVCAELWNAGSMGFALCPLLNVGAVEALTAHGAKDLKDIYLEKMISGEWTSTMNLTEPAAGSDVGALRTKAVPQGDGTYKITGQKIYITYGEHDFTDNIVHLVLARLPDAPAGTKGISLFIVPKFMVNEDGSLGARNDVTCVSLEHKLGIHGSPTCVMSYGDNGGAIGYLVGEENRGMSHMFTMMNNARINVGLQGVGVAERSYQQALAYALDRKQGRRPGQPASESAAIFEHPDVRRTLLTMKSMIESSRAICYKTTAGLDFQHAGTTDEQKAYGRAVAELLTPVAKAFSTDLACDVTSMGVQIHGGMGFIEETGAAQHFRDARITPIYEGTNGIQALDLVGRKLPMQGGAVVKAYIQELRDILADVNAVGGNDAFASMRIHLEAGINALEQTTDWMLNTLPNAADDAFAGATPYLRQFGYVSGGAYLAKMAVAAKADMDAGASDATFLRARITSAQFFLENYTSQAPSLSIGITQGAGVLDKVSAESLTAA